MAYMDIFIFAVESSDKKKFLDHAREFDQIFIDFGATRLVECWGDDVPTGKLTDLRKAVQAKDSETIVCGIAEWPDKATRDRAMEEMHKLMENDPRFDPAQNPPPYDGKRMIFGGFEAIFELHK